MIVYKLKCENDHEFEGWFKSIGSFEEQRKSKTVTCPMCGSVSLTKVLATTRTLKSRKKDTKIKDKEQNKMQYALLKKISDTIRKEFEDVGPKFPEGAKKIFFGESPPKNIFGTTTEKEEIELKDEGLSI